MKKIALVAFVVVGLVGTLLADPFDDAKLWWKFDNGGANGAVAQASEIHDVHDASKGVPTNLYGPYGGPLWTNTTVQLPYRHRDEQSSALYLPVQTNASKKTFATFAGISNGAVQSDSVTFFVRFKASDWMVPDCGEVFFYNNCFVWGSSVSNSFGNLFGISRDGNAFHPRFFVGQKASLLSDITMQFDKWYEIAFSLTKVSETVQRLLCVVAGEEGLYYCSVDYDYVRNVPFSSSVSIIGGQSTHSNWISFANNHTCKNFHGLIHEMAIWDRGLTLGEILDVFGRPEAPPDGDVFSDVFRWWKFDHDLDGNGKVSANELRDVRTWGTAAAPAAGNPGVAYVTDGEPLTWRNMSVLKPACGETVVRDSLVMEPLYRTNENGSKDILTPRIRFSNSTVAGDFTIVTRICITKAYDFLDASKSCYLVHSGFYYGSGLLDRGGYQVGITSVGNSTTNFMPILFAGRSSVSPNLPMTTNTWYDVAYSFSSQADGKDHLTIAVADAKYGIRFWTGTIDTSQTRMVGKVLMLGGENNPTTWSNYANSEGTIVNANALKNFTGAIDQLAIWRRALSKEEIAAAFGYPRAVFGVGTADGKTGEFGTVAEGTYDYTVSDAWHDMAGTLDATHRTLTLRFTPPHGWNGMDQGFHLAVGEVAGSDAKVSLNVNGTGFGSKTVGTGSNLWWIVKGGAVRTGANVATLTLSGTGSVSIDKIEMLGSWALVHGAGNEFSHEESPQVKDFYVGDRNMAHVTRAVTVNKTSNRIHFWVPPCLAANYPFELMFRTYNNASGNAAFAMDVNGTQVFAAPQGLVNGERKFTFGPGELQPGWNEIQLRYLTGSGSWVQFTYYHVRMQGPELGTILIIR